MFSKTEKTVWEKFPELKKVPTEKFPKHFLLIPDGNGRWAKLAQKSITAGHRAGAEAIKRIYNDLWQLPIKYVTIWGFSADNWSRTREEADGIMKVIDSTLKEMIPDAMEKNGRIVHIGRKDRIPEYLRERFEKAEKMTAKNTGTVFSLAVDYSGADQELRIYKKMLADKVKEITPEILIKYRDGGGEIPPADLVVRTSGEKRTSDLGWLCTNSELYFIEKLLPNSGSKDIVEAIIDFSKRERRLGGRPGGEPRTNAERPKVATL